MDETYGCKHQQGPDQHVIASLGLPSIVSENLWTDMRTFCEQYSAHPHAKNFSELATFDDVDMNKRRGAQSKTTTGIALISAVYPGAQIFKEYHYISRQSSSNSNRIMISMVLLPTATSGFTFKDSDLCSNGVWKIERRRQEMVVNYPPPKKALAGTSVYKDHYSAGTNRKS